MPSSQLKSRTSSKFYLLGELLPRPVSLYDLLWKIYEDRYYYDYVGALPNGAQRQANLYALTLRANDYEKQL